jgi:hypothetical protein
MPTFYTFHNKLYKVYEHNCEPTAFFFRAKNGGNRFFKTVLTTYQTTRDNRPPQKSRSSQYEFQISNVNYISS